MFWKLVELLFLVITLYVLVEKKRKRIFNYVLLSEGLNFIEFYIVCILFSYHGPVLILRNQMP